MTDAIDISQDSTTTVREFFTALEMNAIDEAFELVDPQLVWRNTSLPTIRGAHRIRKILEPMERFHIGFAAEIHHIAAESNTVLTERTDILTIGRMQIPFWVCGTFELRHGKIVLWHDYFSWGSVLRGTVTGAAKAIVTSGRRAPR